MKKLRTGRLLVNITFILFDEPTSGLGKGTFYHFFKSKEDFVYQLIEYQRNRFWGYMDMLKGGKDKMTEENGKLLLRGIICNEDCLQQRNTYFSSL